MLPNKCANCSSPTLYTADTSAVGGYGPDLLPKLGSFWAGVKFHVVVCRHCGLTQLFAEESATEKLETASNWRRV